MVNCSVESRIPTICLHYTAVLKVLRIHICTWRRTKLQRMCREFLNLCTQHSYPWLFVYLCTAIVHVCVVQTYATHKPTSNVCTIVNTSAGLGRLINKQSVLKKSVIIDLCLLQSIVRKQHAKWASLIVLNWKRVLIGGLTDHKWVEQLLMVKLMDELLINRV